MIARELQIIRVSQRLEAFEAQRLRLGVLGVHQRHIEELAALLGHPRVPALADRLAGQRQRERIGGEGLGGAAMDIAAELVEQDDRRQHRLGIAAPSLRTGRPPMVAQRADQRPALLSGRRRAANPWLGHQQVEPEAQHFLALRVDIHRLRT